VTVTAEVRDAAGAVVLATPLTTINPVPYARYADHYGMPDCPVGYERIIDTTFFTRDSDRRLCQRPDPTGPGGPPDQVVRVGTGPTAFWIDRFEVVVTEGRFGGTPYGQSSADFPPVFPANGQWTSPRYAVSFSGSSPTRYVTWFQATEACRLSGKRLPTGEEWLTAARGTRDPPIADDGATGRCRTMGSGPRLAGTGTDCVSGWGAQDMVGSLWEWTTEWHLSVATRTEDTGDRPWLPAAAHSDDVTVGVTSYVGATEALGAPGVPAAALRGGAFDRGPGAGVFSLGVYRGPLFAGNNVGFRCVIPR
jgi:formylglycine-generating enzyme required for sulfatase activity